MAQAALALCSASVPITHTCLVSMRTLLLCACRQGVAIWGGPNWERVNRFAHQGVCLLEFSPNEKFLITYSSQVGGSQQV